MNLIETYKGLPAEQRSQTLLGFIDQVKNLKNCSNIVLAKVLYEIEQEGYYEEWTYQDDGTTKTYSSINDFARVVFDYSSSTTQSFLRIHKKLSLDLGVPDDTLAALPWGNLRIVCPHVTEDNLEFVLKLCEGKQKDVRDWASQFAEDSGEKPPKYSFTCSPEQAEIFDTALDIARELYAEETGSPPNNETFVWEYIAAKFLQIEPRPLTLSDHLVILESRFDVRLGLVDEDARVPDSQPPFDEELESPAEPTQETTQESIPRVRVNPKPVEEPKLVMPLAEEEQEDLPDHLTVDDFK